MHSQPQLISGPGQDHRAIRRAGIHEAEQSRAPNLAVIVSVLVANTLLSQVLIEDTNLINPLNFIIPSSILLLCPYIVFKMISPQPLLFLTPFPCFLLACAAYYGLGPLVYLFGSEETIAAVHGYHPIDDLELMRTNLLNVSAIILISVSYIIGRRLFPQFKNAENQSSPNLPALKFFLKCILAVSIPLKYFVILPAHWSATSRVLPGMLEDIGAFTHVGLTLMVIVALRDRTGHWGKLLAVFFITELAVGLLSFNKLSIVMALLSVSLGYFLVHKNVKSLVLMLAVCFLAYLLTVKVVTYSRYYIESESRDLTGRVNVLSTVMSKEEVRSEKQTWWARLNYANAQTFAMNEYDDGQAGDSLWLGVYVPIPRLIWPEKPVISNIGVQFNSLVTGSSRSNSAPGFFAEAYWNGGWWAVCLVCIFLGVLYACVSRFIYRAMKHEQFEMVVIALIWVRVGLRIDGWFAIDCIGPIVVSSILYVLLKYWRLQASGPERRLKGRRELIAQEG